MALKLKHYTYKITFPGMPWFYWGVHTDNGKPYFGSPCTHKWIWDFYECEIQILEWFETRAEAEKAEDRLIEWFWNDPNCLNEHYGSHFSQEGRIRGVQTQQEAGMGIFGEYQPWRAEASVKAVEKMRNEGTGLFDIEVKRKGGKASGEKNILSGHIQALGRKQGVKNVEDGTLLRVAKLGAAAQHSQKWVCLETGYISTACGLSHYQKARGIDKSQRVKLEKENENG